MLGRLVAEVVAGNGPDYPLAALAELVASADLFFVNLECAISARPQRFPGAAKAFYFRAAPEAVQVLESAGVDLVSLANNHTLDAGIEGLHDTLAILARHHIACAGAGNNLAEAAAVRKLHCQGQTIGVLAVCDHQEDFAATPTRAGIHYLDLRRVPARRHLLELVRQGAEGVDHLVVSLHWMDNWVPVIPGPYRQLAGELIDAGARVLWGHSPHHILGIQLWRSGVALYSTGDLIDDYALDRDFRNDRQLLYLLELDESSVLQVTAHPVSLAVGRAEPADGQARRWIEERLRDSCRPLGSEAAAGEHRGIVIGPAAAGGTDVANPGA